MPMTKPLTPALEALVTEIGEDDIHFFDYHDLHDVEDPTQKRTVEFLARNADKVLWTWVTPSYDGIPTTFYCALSEEELAKIFKGIIIGESGGCNSDECTCCGTVTVSFTTSSCNGFIFHAYGYGNREESLGYTFTKIGRYLCENANPPKYRSIRIRTTSYRRGGLYGLG